jgi:hypothetical protein
VFYEAVWYNGWIEPPAYILLEEVEGNTPEEALRDNLDRLTQLVRDIYRVDKEDWNDDDIQDTLYLLSNDRKVSLYTLQRAGLL